MTMMVATHFALSAFITVPVFLIVMALIASAVFVLARLICAGSDDDDGSNGPP